MAGVSNFFLKGTTVIIVGWLATRTCNIHSMLYIEHPKLSCNFHSTDACIYV